MSSKKVISISPELLKPGTSSASSGGKPRTRRARKKKPIQKELRSGTLKKALLRKIKEHQKRTSDQNEKKELVRGKEKGSDNVSLLMKEKADPKEEYSESSFNSSMKYLNELSQKHKKQKNTLRQMKRDKKAQRKMERKQRKQTSKRRQRENQSQKMGQQPRMSIATQPSPPTPPIQDSNPQLMQMQPTTPLNAPVQVYAPPAPAIQPKLVDSSQPLQLKLPASGNSHNKTMKNNVQIHSDLPEDFSTTTVEPAPKQRISVYPNELPEAPPYSNLKNGSKPSFKQWKKTLKNNHSAGDESKVKIHIDDGDDKFNQPMSKREKNLEKLKTKFQDEYDVLTDYKDDKEAMLKEMKRKERRPYKKKITRTIKKIHKLGKKDGTVGVLIKDNKTRKQAYDEYKEICKRPIKEVKDYLREHELLKVGSPAPTDVLRAMYENSVLAGDIHNKNSDVLVHNYMSHEGK